LERGREQCFKNCKAGVQMRVSVEPGGGGRRRKGGEPAARCPEGTTLGKTHPQPPQGLVRGPWRSPRGWCSLPRKTSNNCSTCTPPNYRGCCLHQLWCLLNEGQGLRPSGRGILGHVPFPFPMTSLDSALVKEGVVTLGLWWGSGPSLPQKAHSC
jgi:hypothetical protein